MITESTIRAAISTSDNAVVKGLLHLYGWQTEDEREAHDTKWKNHQGFRVNHAARGAELAEKILKGEGWTASDLAEARGICLCYCNTQLLDLARKIHGCK